MYVYMYACVSFCLLYLCPLRYCLTMHSVKTTNTCLPPARLDLPSYQLHFKSYNGLSNTISKVNINIYQRKPPCTTLRYLFHLLDRNYIMVSDRFVLKSIYTVPLVMCLQKKYCRLNLRI